MNLRRLSVTAGLLLIASICSYLAFRPVQTQRWSNPATWGGRIPRAGDRVVIPPDKNVVLDVDPPRLAALSVAGRLIVPDRDVTIETGAITVTGIVQIGDRRHSFTHHALIRLDPQSGGGVIRIEHGGQLLMHGVDAPTWTHLSRTALPGARNLALATSVRWSAGDRVVIAPSGFAATEAEEATVATSDGTNLTLAEPLKYRHWGEVTDGVDERAEVGLLSHNIVVTSDDASASNGVGGQLLVTQGGRVEIAGVEFLRMGVLGKLGEYPVHFHLAHDGRGSFVASSSVVHSLNRCITIHGTDGVVVKDNVAYDSIGHCIFLEDGIETGNTIASNLVIGVHAATAQRAILESDVKPAGYWITNPSNLVIGNVAAGTDGNGFWFNLSPHPTGPSARSDMWPRQMPLGGFDANVSHSNEYNGLFIDILHNPPGVTEAPNYDPPSLAEFSGFTSYKNRRRGAWLRGTNLVLSHAVVADNSIGVTFAGARDVLRDSLVVGESGNETGAPKPFDPHFPVRGFEFYDGRVAVERTNFVNFEPNRMREASALSFLRFSPFFSDPTNYASGVTFQNAKPVYFEPRRASRDRLGGDGYRSTVFRDVDGSVTGTAGASVVIDTPLLASGTCRIERSWNAGICDATFGSLFVAALGGNPGYVRIEGRDGHVVLHGNPTPSSEKIFQTNLPAQATYTLLFSHAFPHQVRLGFHHFAGGDHIVVRLPQAPRSRLPERQVVVTTDASGNAVVVI